MGIQHTPGPWAFEEYGNHNLLGASGVVVVDTDWGTNIRNQADAILIAAAPTMIDALVLAEMAVEELCQDQDPANQCWVTLAIVRAAINEALGASA